MSASVTAYVYLYTGYRNHHLSKLVNAEGKNKVNSVLANVIASDADMVNQRYVRYSWLG